MTKGYVKISNNLYDGIVKIVSPKTPSGHNGYVISSGYMGFVEELGRYILFCTEDEYLEYIREEASV